MVGFLPPPIPGTFPATIADEKTHFAIREFKLKIADDDLTTRTEKGKEKFIPLAKVKNKRGRGPDVVVHRGEVYLSNDKAERKASGSYYTPDPIVEYIVEHTVGPVLAAKLEALRPRFRKVRKKFDNEVQKATAFPVNKPDGSTWEPAVRIPLEGLVVILNSKLCDWYFRLGSTNAHVNHYQLYSLPVPVFADEPPDLELVSRFDKALRAGRVDDAFTIVEPILQESLFPRTAIDCIAKAVERIIQIETDRGEISRSERSSLAPKAQPLQDLIDRMLFRMAGLTDEEAAALEERLARML